MCGARVMLLNIDGIDRAAGVDEGPESNIVGVSGEGDLGQSDLPIRYVVGYCFNLPWCQWRR